jgi:hypothetical protein
VPRRGARFGLEDRHDLVDGNGLARLVLDLDERPADGEGISASTLSVEISNRGSSRWTVSPTCFIHRVIVPSAIDSPICGITTSTRMRSYP